MSLSSEETDFLLKIFSSIFQNQEDLEKQFVENAENAEIKLPKPITVNYKISKQSHSIPLNKFYHKTPLNKYYTKKILNFHFQQEITYHSVKNTRARKFDVYSPLVTCRMH